jgi:small subunit ribosomal protein S13e
MYGRGKGISSSALPYRRRAPTWLKMKSDEVCDHICKLAKKGLAPSAIGVTLRDSFGIPQVKSVTGKICYELPFLYLNSDGFGIPP